MSRLTLDVTHMERSAVTEQDAAEIVRLLDENPQLRRLGRSTILAELARRNFTDFAPLAWPKLSLSPFHTTYYRVLEAFARGDIQRLMVSVPPQHGKSLASSVLLPAWVLGADADRRIAIASYNATLASRFNRQVQRILASQRYASVFPGSALLKNEPGFTRTAGQLDIPGRQGGIFAVGREGTLTGNSVDVFILDDLYKDAMEANSPVVRENCWEWYTSVVRTRLHNRSQELIVFTRWHEQDLIGRIAEREPVVQLQDWPQLDAPCEGWLHLNFEALKESPPTPLDPRTPGEALWPARHDAASLLAKRRLDSHRFAALYQGRPCTVEGLLYGDRFETYDALPAAITRYGNYTDTADTGEDYLCSVCYCTDTAGTVYITDVVYTQQPMEVTEGLVAAMLSRSGTRTACIESNNGGRGFARALARALPAVAVEWFHQSGNKEARILSNASTLLRTVRMPRDWAVRWPEWHGHLTAYRRTFRANRWHDAADALTGAVERETAPVQGRIKAVRFAR